MLEVGRGLRPPFFHFGCDIRRGTPIWVCAILCAASPPFESGGERRKGFCGHATRELTIQHLPNRDSVPIGEESLFRRLL